MALSWSSFPSSANIQGRRGFTSLALRGQGKKSPEFAASTLGMSPAQMPASPFLFWPLCSHRPDMDLLLLGCLPVLHGLSGGRALLPELQIHNQAAYTSQLPGKQQHVGQEGEV